MSVAQRRVLAVGGVVAVMLLLVLLLTRGDGGGGAEQRLSVEGTSVEASTTTSAAPAAETTLPLVAITTGVPVPEPTEAPPPTAPPSATPAAPRTTSTAAGTTTAAPSPGTNFVDGTGALLGRPAGAPVRPVDKAKGCNSANDAGWKIDECGALRTNGTVLLWVVERKGKATRVLVLKEQTAGQWATLLQAGDGNGAWSHVGVHAEDISGDGQPELIFGFHGATSDKPVAMDLVDGNANVGVHRDLAHGIVQTAKGSLTTWSAAGDGYDQSTVTYAGGRWQASAAQRVPRSAAPQASSV